MTRQQRFRERFESELRSLKNQYGHGQYSWAEGMTRKAARRIEEKRTA